MKDYPVMLCGGPHDGELITVRDLTDRIGDYTRDLTYPEVTLYRYGWMEFDGWYYPPAEPDSQNHSPHTTANTATPQPNDVAPPAIAA